MPNMESRRATQIAEALQQQVFSGRYEDGDKLDEVRLAEQFEVSRTPIREALQELVGTGLAEQIPRRGVFVRLPGPVELMEMFETMAELEAACARLAASRITDTGLAQLREANSKCQEAIEVQDFDRYYAQNEAFHQAIYRGAANGFLAKQAAQLQNRLKPYRKEQLRFRGRMDQSMAEHVAIVAALERGDGRAAEQALRDHVAVQGEKFHQLMANLNSK